jgi:hypothetical protein
LLGSAGVAATDESCGAAARGRGCGAAVAVLRARLVQCLLHLGKSLRVVTGAGGQLLDAACIALDAFRQAGEPGVFDFPGFSRGKQRYHLCAHQHGNGGRSRPFHIVRSAAELPPAESSAAAAANQYDQSHLNETALPNPMQPSGEFEL